MNIRGKLKDELKQKDSKNRAFYQHQAFAETAVNALEQRTFTRHWLGTVSSLCFSPRSSHSLPLSIDGIRVIRASSVHWVRFDRCPFIHPWFLVCISRTFFTKRGNVDEDDQCWHEHCSTELLSWVLRSNEQANEVLLLFERVCCLVSSTKYRQCSHSREINRWTG